MFIGAVVYHGKLFCGFDRSRPQKSVTKIGYRLRTLPSSIRCAVKKLIWNFNYSDVELLARATQFRRPEIFLLWGVSTTVL